MEPRNVFFFSKDKDEVSDWSDEYPSELIDQMNKNIEDGNIWKIILSLQCSITVTVK